ncbi:MAG: hypothetical protein RLZ98_2898 [Pseudomonadota bacterium]|jgi:multicomponent Na+:H+ antiporter subunit G
MTGLDSPLVAQSIELVSWILILLGSFFIVVGMVGVMRMPDVYTRMHATSVTETLGASILIIGLLLQTDIALTIFKLITILGIIFFTGPVVTHALAQAALHAGVDPLLHEDRTDRIDAPSTAASNDESSNGRPPSNS